MPSNGAKSVAFSISTSKEFIAAFVSCTRAVATFTLAFTSSKRCMDSSFLLTKSTVLSRLTLAKFKSACALANAAESSCFLAMSRFVSWRASTSPAETQSPSSTPTSNTCPAISKDTEVALGDSIKPKILTGVLNPC